MDEGYEPVADEETIYRRVPASMTWYDPSTKELNPEAFGPRRDDDSGISVSRAKYATIEQAARGFPGKAYFVAILNAGAIRQAGLAIEPKPDIPTGFDPAHAEIPDLNASNRKSDPTLERQRLLVELCLDVVGPYATPAD